MRYKLDYQKDDIARLKVEYEKRERLSHNSSLYSHFNRANLFAIQQRERQLIKLLSAMGITHLDWLKTLEIGCGSGGILCDFLRYGAKPDYLFGIDLLHNRLREAHARLIGSSFTNADGQCLPFPGDCFDLLLQYTAFTSVIDPLVKHNMAADMLRVLKPTGLIIWYDFWWNPTNPQTAGIKPKEIRQLFPGCHFNFKKITLAPPIARKIVPISWPFASFLEFLKIFNSHYLVLIKKENR